MFRRSEKGFTLVELMIVVVIIGILASIAIPKFASLIGRTKTTEAKTILGQIVQGEETYFFTSNAYIAFAAGADCAQIGFEQPGGRFTYSFTPADSLATAQESEDVNGDNDTDDGLTLSLSRVQGSLTPQLVW